jgi:hypothetical protein
MIRSLRLIRDRKLTLATLLDELLPLRGDRLVSLGEEGEGPEGSPPHAQRLADLYLQAGAMSRFLAEETGFRRGERVAIFKTNNVECFRWFLAVIRAGGIAVPLNPMLTLPELQSASPRVAESPPSSPTAPFLNAPSFRATLSGARLGPDRCDRSSRRVSALYSGLAPGSATATRGHRSLTRWPSSTPRAAGLPKGAQLSSSALLAGRAGAFCWPRHWRKAALAPCFRCLGRTSWP